MIGSLFSGIGGLELGLERAGLGAVAWQVECDPFCLRVLARHWPHAKRFDDVQTVGAANLLPVDGICGGFPCQDVSSAGRRAGLDGARSGLWFEYRRLVEELRPRWCVVENVTSGERAWLPRVQHDLVSAGYRTKAIRLGAVDVGAPHRRQRTFVLAVANAPGERWQRGEIGDASLGLADGSRSEGASGSGARVLGASTVQSSDPMGNASAEGWGRWGIGPGSQFVATPGRGAPVGNPDAQRQYQSRRTEPDQRRRAQDAGDPELANADRGEGQQQPGRRSGPRRTRAVGAVEAGLRQGGGADAQREMGRDADGLPRTGQPPMARRTWAQDQEAWEPPRVARRGEIPENAARLRALGNAVVPQVAELVGRQLLEWLEEP